MIKKEKRKILRLAYVIGTFLTIVIIGFVDPTITNAMNAIKSVDLGFMFLTLLCLLFFWITDGLLLYHITSYIFGKVSFPKSLKVGIIGLYYGALTPFATGGQPAQVIYMKRNDIQYGISLCIVLVKFIVYEVSLCLFYVIAMVFRGGYFFYNHKQVFWFTTLGFLINLGAIIFIVFVMLRKSIPYKISYGLI